VAAKARPASAIGQPLERPTVPVSAFHITYPTCTAQAVTSGNTATTGARASAGVADCGQIDEDSPPKPGAVMAP
jgi:hypothetical protein